MAYKKIKNSKNPTNPKKIQDFFWGFKIRKTLFGSEQPLDFSV